MFFLISLALELGLQSVSRVPTGNSSPRRISPAFVTGEQLFNGCSLCRSPRLLQAPLYSQFGKESGTSEVLLLNFVAISKGIEYEREAGTHFQYFIKFLVVVVLL